MAVDTFLHDEDGLGTIISDIKSSLSSYREKIERLESLISAMNSSSSWIDAQVKTSFINTANSYITLYNNFCCGLESLITCLSKKSGNIVEHESNYS